jgi:hypothetical protein
MSKAKSQNAPEAEVGADPAANTDNRADVSEKTVRTTGVQERRFRDVVISPSPPSSRPVPPPGILTFDI